MTDAYTPRTDLSGKAKDVVNDLKAKAAGMGEDLTRVAKDNAAQLSDNALEFASAAKAKVDDVVSERKSIGAEYIGSVAKATQQAARAFESDLPQAAHLIRQASEQMQGLADNIKQRDVRELVGEVQTFARQQPTLFFGGAVVLGFAALRFLKSTPVTQASGSDSSREG